MFVKNLKIAALAVMCLLLLGVEGYSGLKQP